MSNPAPNGSAADHNLLFGILAVQMDFVSRDQLIAAMHAWVLAKTRPLSDFLLDGGALTSENHRLLEQMVAAHIKAHSGDVQRSLAAVAHHSTLGDMAQSLADPDLQASLVAAGATLATTAAERPNEDGLRYRILRPHAQGGLGVVSVAIDTEVGREVAFKEIQVRYAEDLTLRGRFVREAEITGGLEHPGIVPVYGLGRYSDGRPYYAMRFIRGESLQEAIKKLHTGDAGYTLRGLLTRFVAACNAVAYAHSRGVIHRDLKPSNVMLGPYGETLVVDWGLAKVIGRETTDGDGGSELTLQPPSGDGSPTRAGAALGTPAFMSPEQARGEVTELRPATDVYSLGATLYAILTGRPPVQGRDTADVLERVRLGDWPRPRQVNSRLPLALDAVCQKAMALRSADRYSSPLTLSADVDHWLADEPVRAYSASLTERAARWARKHRAASVATAAILAVTAGAAAVVAILASLSSAEIKKQRDAADANYTRAEENFRFARQSVQDYLTRVSENKLLKTQDRQDLRELRKELLEDALRFYQKFIDQHGDDSQQRLDLADAYERVASVTKEIGSKTEALKAAQQAVPLRESLARAEPDNAEAQERFAATLFAVGALERETGEFEAARAAFHRARDIFQALTADHPENLHYRRQFAKSLNGLGGVAHDASDPHEALDAYQEAAALVGQLVNEKPEDIAMRELQGTIVNNIGLVQQQLGEKRQAQHAYERAVQVFGSLSHDQPDDPLWRNLLAAAHNDLGRLAENLGDLTEGRRRLRLALDLHVDVVRRHPTVLDFQDDLARTYMNLGDLERDAGDPATALPLMQQCLEIRAKLARDNPKVFWFQSQWAATYLNIGVVQATIGKLDVAAESLQRGIAIEAPLADGNPDKPKLASTLGRIYYHLGLVRLDQNRRPEALAAIACAIEHHRKAFEKSPQVPEFRECLSDDYLALANLHQGSHQFTEALTALRACRPLWGSNGAELYRIAASMARCGASDEALATLKDAVGAGFCDADQMAKNPDFAPLRDRAIYQELLLEVQAHKKKTTAP
jgi:serine/threonine-protein kinase